METEVKKRTRRPNKAVHHGYTHLMPKFLFPMWRRTFCKHGWHLWDEWISVFQSQQRMTCDACGDVVKIR